jgi:hypothetical protein
MRLSLQIDVIIVVTRVVAGSRCLLAHWPIWRLDVHCHKSRPIFRDIPRSVDAC